MASVTFQPTAADMLAAKRLHYRLMLATFRVWRRFLIFIALLALGFVAWSWLMYDLHTLVVLLSGMLFGLLMIGLIVLSGYAQLGRRTRRIFAQQKEFHQPIEIGWSETGIDFASSRGTGHYAWGDFIRIAEDRDVIILMRSDDAMTFIPKRALSAEQSAAILSHAVR